MLERVLEEDERHGRGVRERGDWRLHVGTGEVEGVGQRRGLLVKV